MQEVLHAHLLVGKYLRAHETGRLLRVYTCRVLFKQISYRGVSLELTFPIVVLLSRSSLLCNRALLNIICNIFLIIELSECILRTLTSKYFP